MRLSALTAVVLSLLFSSAALAWNKPGHMVSGAVAYDLLKREQSEALVHNVSGERLCYDIDTMGGQSGSGVWTEVPGLGYTIVAVHTTGSGSGNGGTRITRDKLGMIFDWIRST